MLSLSRCSCVLPLPVARTFNRACELQNFLGARRLTVASPLQQFSGSQLPSMDGIRAAAATTPETAAAAAPPAPQPALKLVLVVAVALFDGQGRVLLAQRPEGKAMAGLWEFPGGKIEAGERPEVALSRELREELGIEVAEAELTPLAFASHAYEHFHLLMPLFACTKWEGEPTGKEGQALRWETVEGLPLLEYPAADVPLLPSVVQAMNEIIAGSGIK